MSILEEIVKNTILKLAEKKLATPLAEIQSELARLNLPKGAFKANLLNKDQAIIAEIKKASPSAGIISEDFDPIQKAKDYEVFGAAALSILTEEDFFLGSIEYLKEVKAITSLPILRKDFMVDEYQIYEAKLMGADCILLIVSILSDAQITAFVTLAEELELDYLIEVHDETELSRVEHFKNAMIGVNNRDLKTFTVDLDNSVRLKHKFEHSNIFIAESGIKNQDDIDYLKSHQIHAFLIGESLMRDSF
ncbi:indole-3-glycerol phosphate synthase TrpC [Gammaproteobacteria bacterium]|nr:indole-3-glycerol phosphate synthase TrpC [Gammaproteobacteria bacterium]